jgi:hypothetical protein
MLHKALLAPEPPHRVVHAGNEPFALGLGHHIHVVLRQVGPRRPFSGQPVNPYLPLFRVYRNELRENGGYGRQILGSCLYCRNIIQLIHFCPSRVDQRGPKRGKKVPNQPLRRECSATRDFLTRKILIRWHILRSVLKMG